MTSTSPGVLAASVPIATAIGVFGVVYGAAGTQVMGPGLTVLSSALTFSGAAQFATVGLLAAGATPAGVLGAVASLALRHIPLGAVVRPRMTAGPGRRALVSLFLIDETTGLALTRAEPAERTLMISGGLSYTAWMVGTIAGVAGGTLAAVEPLAAALFPVLFVGLAALTATSRNDGARALLAGGASLGLLLLWPAAGALGALAVAIIVAAIVPAA
jgi:predicted branched-subunit amino acid permease